MRLHEVYLRSEVRLTALQGQVIGVVILIVAEVLAVVFRELLILVFLLLLAVIIHGLMDMRQHFTLINDSLFG